MNAARILFACALAVLVLQGLLPGHSLAQQGGRQAPEAFWSAIRLDEVKKLETEMLRGASANASHPEHGPAIVMAARERSPGSLAYLARLAGTRLDAANVNGETALMLVALQGDLDSVRLLVERGAAVNRPGWTPLHYAAAGGHLPVIGFLIDAHAYIDAESPNRTTPLMMAARQKHTSAMRMLIEAGADPGLRNEAGYAAADYMDAHGEKAEAQWLRERAAEFRNRYGTVAAPRPASAVPQDVAPSMTRPAPAPATAPAAEASTGKPAPVARPVQPSSAQPVRLPGMRD